MARIITKTLALLVVILAVAQCCFAANILILSLPYYSHLAGIANVGKYLQSQGHDVRIAIPPQLKEKLQNYGIKPLLYHSLGEFPEERLVERELWQLFFETPPLLPVIFSDVQPMTNQISTKIVRDANLRKNIETFKPDLVLLDSTPVAVMLTLIPYKLNIPFVMLGSTAFPQCTRAPILPTVIPFKYSTYSDRMSFQERVSNTLTNLIFYRRSLFINSSLVNEYIPDEPYISPRDLQAKAQLWIVRQHSMLDYNQPLMPNVIRLPHLLDLTSFTPKRLPQEFQSFIESADNGVVLVSFGSVLSSMPAQVKDKLLQAFEQTKYKFIIQSFLQPNNMQSDKFMSRKWLPQFDLLRHQKTKLFISHCGSNGLQETLTAGVPIICVPLYGDQLQHAVVVARNGFGLKLDIKLFSIQELVSAIEEVITNPSYKSKVEKVSAIFQSERVPPIEEAAYWINHVLKFGGDHLRSYAQDVPLWKYLGLDIIAFCLLLWHVVVYLVIILLRCCLSLCCASKQKLKDE